MPDLDFISSQHPIYDSQRSGWRMNERRWRGSRGVLGELARFDWELVTGERYRARVNEATYINFADLFLRTMVGHLMKQAPGPDDGLSFGGLGTVARGTGPNATATRAELLWYNVDGAGQDGSAWNPYWAAALQRAGVCGHRWMLAEASRIAPESRLQERQGLRPYLTDFSPLSVPDWHFEEGSLQYAIIDIWARNPKMENGSFKAAYELQKYVLVKRGWQGFGPEFEQGGWWIIDASQKAILDEGRWDLTNGEIPMWPLFWERDDGEPPESPENQSVEKARQVAQAGGGSGHVYKPIETLDGPNISRSGITWLGQIGVSYMNMSSAADFDAWDAAKSTKIIIGASVAAFNLLDEKAKEGAIYLPLPLAPDGTAPTIHDASSGAVVAEVFETRLNRKRMEARDLAALEASGTPDASGVSKELGFSDAKSPVLARLSSEIETAQNNAIRYLEMRFGVSSPSGVVSWPRDYQLKPLIEDIREIFELQELAGISSPTLEGRLMVQAAKDKGLITDDQQAVTVTEEYASSARDKADREAQAGAAGAGPTGGPGAPGGDDLGGLF